MRRYLSAWLLSTALSISGAETPPLVELQPQQTFSLAATLRSTPWTNIQVQEMRAAADGLWFFVLSRDQPQAAILSTGFDGSLRTLIDLGPVKPSGGFVVTSRGVAIVVWHQKKTFFREYDRRGNLLAAQQVPCATHLLAIGGTPSTLCSDGTIVTYTGGRASARHGAWARIGSLVEPLSANRLAIVDPGTVQALLCDLETNELSAVTIRTPEIEEALRTTAGYTAQLAKAARETPQQAPSRPIVAMDTAAGTSGWYILIGPYHRDVGPAVVKLDQAGAVTARLRLRTPPSTAGRRPAGGWHKIESQGSSLLLGSSRGDVIRYAP